MQEQIDLSAVWERLESGGYKTAHEVRWVLFPHFRTWERGSCLYSFDLLCLFAGET
jgi:hypothetical protein